MQILLILQGIQAALAAAPGFVDVAVKAKDLIAALFNAKVISKQQQDAIHAHVDSYGLLVASGIVPPHWQVDADPISSKAAKPVAPPASQ